MTHFGADVIETFPAIACLPAPPLTGGAFALPTQHTFEWQDAAALPMPDPTLPEIYSLIEADLREFPDYAVILDNYPPWGHIANLSSALFQRKYLRPCSLRIFLLKRFLAQNDRSCSNLS